MTPESHIGVGELSRRALTKALASGVLGLVTLACDDSAQPLGEQSSGGQSATSYTGSRESVRVDSASGGSPRPGERRPIAVGMLSLDTGRNSHLVRALEQAANASDFRYVFEPVAIPDSALFEMRLGAAINTLGDALDLVLAPQWSIYDIVKAEAVQPIRDYLAGRASLSESEFWSAVFDAGAVEGEQYFVPASVILNVIAVNVAHAEFIGVELPLADRKTFDFATFLDLAQRLHVPPDQDGNNGIPGFPISVNPDADPTQPQDVPIFPFSSEFLASAIGRLDTSPETIDLLASQDAVNALEDLRALVRDFGFAMPPDEFYRHLDETRYGMTVFSLRGGIIDTFSHALYPYPDFGSGRTPAIVDRLLGISAASADPAVAYDSSIVLAQSIGDVAGFPALRKSPREIELLYPGLDEGKYQLLVEMMDNLALINLPPAAHSSLFLHVDLGAILGSDASAAALQKLANAYVNL